MEFAYSRGLLAVEVQSGLLVVEVRSRLLAVEVRLKFGRRSTTVETWMESDYCRSPAAEEARSLTKSGGSSE